MSLDFSSGMSPDMVSGWISTFECTGVCMTVKDLRVIDILSTFLYCSFASLDRLKVLKKLDRLSELLKTFHSRDYRETGYKSYSREEKKLIAIAKYLLQCILATKVLVYALNRLLYTQLQIFG